MIQLLVGEIEVHTTYKEYMPPLYHQNTNDLATSNRIVFMHPLYFFLLSFSPHLDASRIQKGLRKALGAKKLEGSQIRKGLKRALGSESTITILQISENSGSSWPVCYDLRGPKLLKITLNHDYRSNSLL